ncbi:MAG: alpha/beta hydrolase [Desulfuromonas sp.]|nr:MAG: alpha/beta hydrolase [Desulfuromonas sp.]
MLGLLLLAGCSPGRGYEAALVLADMAAGEKPSLLKRTTPEPRVTPVAFAVDGRGYRGDLYRPGEQALAGMLLVPGAAEKGKDDPRLVAYARTLARARFNVLVPDLESLRALRVGPGNVGEVVDAFSWLVDRAGLVPGGRAGITAFSYAAGPVLLAAMDPTIRHRVKFVHAVGGYYDLPAVLGFFTTGYFREAERWGYREPNAYGKWVFVLSNAGRLSERADREALEEMAWRRMEDLGAELSDLEAMLGSEGQAVYAFVANGQQDRVASLFQGLPAGIRNDIEALDLSGKDLSHLSARLILVHGTDDDIIPYTESVALAGALPQGQARLFLADGLAHVTLRPGLFSRWRLWRAVDALLGEREGE